MASSENAENQAYKAFASGSCKGTSGNSVTTGKLESPSKTQLPDEPISFVAPNQNSIAVRPAVVNKRRMKCLFLLPGGKKDMPFRRNGMEKLQLYFACCCNGFSSSGLDQGAIIFFHGGRSSWYSEGTPDVLW